MKMLSKSCSCALVLAALSVTSLSRATAVVITNTDPRDMCEIQCGMEFNYNGNHYYDWQDISGVWPANTAYNWGITTESYRWSCSGGQCGGDGLYFRYTSNGSKQIIISKMDGAECYQDPDSSDSGHNIRVQCWFTVDTNGDHACDSADHFDWQDILGNDVSWCGGPDINLILNGNGGSWNGSYWGGDLLHS